jgi:hypothetical protein
MVISRAKAQWFKPLTLLLVAALFVALSVGLVFLPIINGWQSYKNRLNTIQNDELVAELERCYKQTVGKELTDLDPFRKVLHRYAIDDGYLVRGDAIGIAGKAVVIEFGGNDHHFGLVLTEEGGDPGDPWGHARPRKIGSLTWLYDQGRSE